MRRRLPVPKDWKPYKFPVRPTVYRSAAGAVARAAWTFVPPHVKLGLLAAGAVAAGVARYRSVSSNQKRVASAMQFTDDRSAPKRSRVSESGESAYRSEVRQPVVTQDASGYVQLTRFRRDHVGSSLIRQEMLNRHAEANMLHKVDRWQYMVSTDSTNGNWYTGVTSQITGGYTYLPVYAFDLTSLESNSMVDVTNSSNVAKNYAQPFMRLQRLETAPYNFAWTPLFGLAADGVTLSKRWQVERQPYLTASASNTPYSKAFLRWADIRMQIFGATSQPSALEVMIVRFHDPDIIPSAWEEYGPGAATLYTDLNPPPTGGVVAPPTPATYDQDRFARYQKFWSSQIDNLITNPNGVRFRPSDAEGMTVLYRRKIDFNPIANYEADTAGHQYTMKVSYDMDMVGDYNHRGNPLLNGDELGGIVQISNPNKWPVETEVQTTHSFLRNDMSRVFLIIKGYTCSKSADDNNVTFGDKAKAASFDLCVRRQITLI